jgi:antitoxin component HigA of HigAB toxin-antitoxin module
MPTAYQALLVETEPATVENEEQYKATMTRLSGLLRKGKARNQSETRLMRLLMIVVEDYDRKHALPPLNDTPAERLQYVLEISGKAPSDLIPVFNQKSHVTEALKGTRPISAAQARKLGKIFKLNPGYFV